MNPTVSLRVYSVVRQARDDCVVLVWCVAGPARLGARFRQVEPHGTIVEFVLTRAERYVGSTVPAVWPGEGAEVELTGGGWRLRPGDLLIGYQPPIIRE